MLYIILLFIIVLIILSYYIFVNNKPVYTPSNNVDNTKISDLESTPEQNTNQIPKTPLQNLERGENTYKQIPLTEAEIKTILEDNVIFYASVNYTSPHKIVKEGIYNIIDFPFLINSVKNTNFNINFMKGNTHLFTKDSSNAKLDQTFDRVEVIKKKVVEPQPVKQTISPPTPKGVKVWNGANFTGINAFIGHGNHNLKTIPGMSNSISSFEVTDGCTASFYDKDNFSGQTMVKKGPILVKNLDGTGLNDDIASIRVTCS